MTITFNELINSIHELLTVNAHLIKEAIEEYLLINYGEDAFINNEDNYPHAFDIDKMAQHIANKLNNKG